MKIRLATQNDLDSIWQLRLETTELLKARNIDQWQYKDPSLETFKNDIEANEFYIAEQEGFLIGMMSVRTGIEHTYDKIYEGLWNDDLPYVTIHRLAVKRNLLGSRISEELMKYTEKIAIDKKINYIRIDTHEQNKYAIRLFEALGYKLCGYILLNQKEGELKRLAFDKKVGNN